MSKGFRVWSAEDLDRRPDMDWLVEGMVPAQGLGTVYGPSGVGKTFLALDLALAVASGKGTWAGRRVLPGARRVVYVAAEGQTGMRNRVREWRRMNPSIRLDFFLVPDAIQLMSTADADAFISDITAAIGETLDLLVIDTWSVNTPGADENSRGDVSVALANLGSICRAFNAVGIIIHHTGSRADKNSDPRGSSAFIGAMDFAWHVYRHGKGLVVGCKKMRDGSPFSPIPFRLRGEGASCIVDFTETTSREQPTTLSDVERSALTVLAELAEGKGGATSTKWRDSFGKSEATFYRVLILLQAKGLVNHNKPLYSVSDAGALIINELSFDSRDSLPNALNLSPSVGGEGDSKAVGK